MKRFAALIIIALLIGFAYTRNASSTNAQSTDSASTAKQAPATTQSTDSQRPSHTDDSNRSESVADSAKRYWNKFIDVLAGPADNK